MNHGMGCLAVTVFSGMLIWNARAQMEDYRNPALDFETRAADLVGRMSLEEMISQLGNGAPGIERLGIKPYDWWNEGLHGVARAGVATVFPQAIGMAASFDPDTMYEVACVISDEARAKYNEAQRSGNYGRYFGLTYWSPNINIFRDPRWGRGHETYGEDPYLTGRMGMEFVRGLQGDDPKYLKLVATAKHYAVHNGPEKDRHHFNAVPSARDLWETYLPAFHDLVVDAKVYSVMGAYNRVDSESASASWMLLEDILRRRWNFEGYVVSDCGAIRDIFANHKIVNDASEAAAVGVRRGCDLNCGGVYQSALMEAVEKGYIDESEIVLAAYRLMLARMKLGMFDPPESVPYAAIPYSVVDSPEHDELALEMARKSMTLLKNNGLLPLDKTTIKTIAVVGPNADSVPVLRGNYNGDASHPVTILEGIRQAVGDEVSVFYAPGCPLADGVGNENLPIVDSACLYASDESGRRVHGLKGEYFLGTELKGKPVLTRIDPEIKMNFGRTSPTTTAIAQGILSPDQEVPADNFSIRWTGQLIPPASGTYTLGMVSDDGCRLYLDGKKIVDDWTTHGMQACTAETVLEKGRRYDITLEYFEGSKDAGVHFVWELPRSENDEKAASREMLDQVQMADVAIFVGGLTADIEGEEMSLETKGFDHGDRSLIELPDTQLETLRAMLQTGTPVVYVQLAGSAIALSGLENELPAILMGWYPGQRGGNAVADVLFGGYNPAGRLPVTFYRSTDDLGDFTDYAMAGGPGKTYRYFKGEPLYPFGHGLSYTAFEYSNLQIGPNETGPEGEITVRVDIENTGGCAGEEVVQLYVHDVESDRIMPMKQLRGFKRIALEKGEKTTVTFTLSALNDLRYYDAVSQQYAVEPGDFEIQVGASSADIRQRGTVTIR
ncbi:MAG: glycoside hydrolase family 3 C-terminal domain-containing protein [Pontiellaceae bacterium]|nr:glycoside hydrolase family 3 C-terminal domain-containing protein [Pontiellaceae bacterium]MBN2785969.1 glycoside hydrolase family 3 C-terminal domain-containing protein [Pontiellaceae bacterium]